MSEKSIIERSDAMRGFLGATVEEGEFIRLPWLGQGASTMLSSALLAI
jgi:hypothetical protein